MFFLPCDPLFGEEPSASSFDDDDDDRWIRVRFTAFTGEVIVLPEDCSVDDYDTNNSYGLRLSENGTCSSLDEEERNTRCLTRVLGFFFFTGETSESEDVRIGLLLAFSSFAPVSLFESEERGSG